MSPYLLVVAWCITAAWSAGAACRLRISVQPGWAGGPLVVNKLSPTNDAGEAFSVRRLDLLVSDFSLHQKQGAWQSQANGQAFLSLSQNRTDFDIEKLAPGDY